MKDQINTIREALTAALSDDQPYIEACKQALTALDQLEAMAGEQEPVAWVDERAIAWIKDHPRGKITTTLEAKESYERPMAIYTAAPVAQQPQARQDFTDEWTGYLKDGETPFERFLRERKDLQSVLKLYQRVLEENERLKGQQPKAEHDLKDVRCGYCGYMTYHREHMNCIRAASRTHGAAATD